MKRATIFFAFLLFLPILIFPQKISSRKTNFDRDWRFHAGHASDPSKDFNYKIVNIFSKSGKAEGTAIDPKYNDSSWQGLDLPHDWAVELPFVNSENPDVIAHGYKPIGGLFPENSVGWYRKSFSIPAADSGSRYAIQFDGIFRDANVWINGFFLANNASGYIGFSCDITDYVNFNKENTIVVGVDATQSEGWFYEGAGIYRHVWLLQYDQLHIAENGVFVYSEVNGKSAEITIESTLTNETNSEAECTVQSVMLDRSGNVIAKSKESKIKFSLNETKTVQQQLNIPSFRWWSLEDPYLYRMKTIVRSNGKIIDEVTNRFGIRTLSIDAVNGLKLNGIPLKIKGGNNHQDHAGVGSALPDYLQYYRIGLLKQMGTNAYRCSHNAPTPELLDACDSLGMLVMDETRLLNSGDEYEGQLRRLILRDRNHPSVFMWSIGNEEGWVQRNSVGKRLALSSIAVVKELDPTRTCTYAADMANEFNGINEVIPVRGFNYREKALIPYHTDHPDQPIIGTEMGSTVTTRGITETDSARAYLPDQDITAPWWASTAEAWWPIAAENDWMAGGFIWTGFDYRGEPTPFIWPNINSHFGVMDVCGFPKNIYYYYQSWWSDKDVIHISPHWNHPGKDGQIMNVWVNSNADEVELFQNGKSLGKKVMPRNSHLNWDVRYFPGSLEAVGIRNGKEIRTKVETTGAPFELMLTSYKTTLFADGKDATVINVSVIDDKGMEVPYADNLVRFKLTGDARILGVGNGDPSSHEPDQCNNGTWQRSLFNGHCQLILQAGEEPGIVKLEAQSDGLYKAGTEIHLIPACQPIQPLDETLNRIRKSTVGKDVGKILGADISFLPELEAQGMKFSENGQENDAIEILKIHGFNYIRLRIFHSPSGEKGYSPSKGFCDLNHTMLMAKRIKAAGMKFLLDFHYSDYWADPQQQFKPAAWEGLDFETLTDSLRNYTRHVIKALKDQGTLPDMVQIGNEINHGMVWPDGHISHPDQLAALIKAGTEGVKAVDANVLIMLHLALGGQQDESIFWFDNMFSRGVDCDLIGLSYYPRWHGTLADLESNMDALIVRYNKPVNVVEYSHRKYEVNAAAFGLPQGKATGSFIWEPLNTLEKVFDFDGKANEFLLEYDVISRRFLK